jgi:RND family efflux transporter MFP subunit
VITDHVATFQYSGLMASATESKPSFKIGGIIAKVFVKEGDKVLKGQLLATLDLTEINAQIEQAGKGIEKIKRDLGRVKNLYNDTAATLEQVQNVQTQLDVSNENLRIAQFNRQYAQIKAAENGTVIKKFMNEGDLAGPGIPLFLITGNTSNDWVVRFGASDKDWAALKTGDIASVNIDAYPDKPFKAVITKMAAAADPYSNTYEVEVKVLPGNERFAAGLFSKIELHPAKKQKVAVVPIEAITEGDGKNAFVFTLNSDGKTVKKHAVKVAFIEDNKVGIVSGLEGIDEVITAGVGYLSETSVVSKATKK